MNFTKMLSQASMNTLKKWLAEVVETLKTVSYELAYHESRDKR